LIKVGAETFHKEVQVSSASKRVIYNMGLVWCTYMQNYLRNTGGVRGQLFVTPLSITCNEGKTRCLWLKKRIP